MKSSRLFFFSFIFTIAASLGAEPDLPPKAALDAINAEDLLKHIKVLASDEYEGRAPGFKGEELSVKYISDQFKALGLKPGNPNGSYTREVPLAGITTTPTASFSVKGKQSALKFPDDYVASSARLQKSVHVDNSEIIFVDELVERKFRDRSREPEHGSGRGAFLDFARDGKEITGESGQDFDTLKKAALSKDFRPVSLGAKADFDLKQAIRSFKSHNVVGKIEGSDPKLKDEWILYSAHWDHLGKHSELEGDQIFNGALDNASGVAAILELAQAHMKLPKAAKRSVLVMATTAEEAGLLGAKYYAENPLYPLTKTLADINIDGRARS